MEWLLVALKWIHISAGMIGLGAFWVPIFSRKGGKNHRLFGKVFKYSAYLVLGAAALTITMHLINQIFLQADSDAGQFTSLIFLGYLTIVTFVGMRHGLAVLSNKADLEALNIPINRFMARVAIFSSLAVIAYALVFQPSTRIILFALSPIGFGIGFGILNAIRGKRTGKKAWFYEHMGAMMGTGIAFHTAFAVFGSIRLFSYQLAGWQAVIPWILPTLVGIPAIAIWTRYYQRKFRDLT